MHAGELPYCRSILTPGWNSSPPLQGHLSGHHRSQVRGEWGEAPHRPEDTTQQGGHCPGPQALQVPRSGQGQGGVQGGPWGREGWSCETYKSRRQPGFWGAGTQVGAVFKLQTQTEAQIWWGGAEPPTFRGSLRVRGSGRRKSRGRGVMWSNSQEVRQSEALPRSLTLTLGALFS